jgi:hypothetical protein
MGHLRQDFPLSELVDNLAARPVDPRLYRAQRAIQRHGDVLITHLLLMKQHKGLPIFWSDVGQGPLDLFAQMPRRIIRGAVIGELLGQGAGLRSATSDGQQAPAAVSGNGQEPRYQVSRSIPVRQAPQCPHKALLSHVFGIVPVAQHPVTQAKNLALKPFDKPHHGGLLTRQTTVN